MTSQPAILIIDDDRALTGMIAAMLSANHYAVFTAYDGRKGCASCTSTVPT